MCGRLDLEPHFLGRLRHERFTSNQIASQHRTSFAGRHKQPIYLFKPQWAGPVLPLHPLYHNNWSLPYRFGPRLIKWRQRPDMTFVIDCDVKHQRKQILIVKFTIFKVLVPVLSVHPSYHKYWSLLYRYLPYTLFLPLTPYPILQVLVPVSKALVPVLPLAPLYHKYWDLF